MENEKWSRERVELWTREREREEMIRSVMRVERDASLGTRTESSVVVHRPEGCEI